MDLPRNQCKHAPYDFGAFRNRNDVSHLLPHHRRARVVVAVDGSRFVLDDVRVSVMAGSHPFGLLSPQAAILDDRTNADLVQSAMRRVVVGCLVVGRRSDAVLRQPPCSCGGPPACTASIPLPAQALCRSKNRVQWPASLRLPGKTSRSAGEPLFQTTWNVFRMLDFHTAQTAPHLVVKGLATIPPRQYNRHGLDCRC